MALNEKFVYLGQIFYIPKLSLTLFKVSAAIFWFFLHLLLILPLIRPDYSNNN